MRAFIALSLTEDVCLRVADLQERLRKAIDFTGSRLAWVPPRNLHITLKFLGDAVPADEPHLELLQHEMAEAVHGLEPVEIVLNGIGCFPGVRNPKVLWVGLRKKDLASLKRIAFRLDFNLATHGYAREEREFRPHLTLGRFQRLRHTPSLTAIMTSHHDAARFTVRFDHIALMESDLSGPDPVYRELRRIEFPGAHVPPGGADPAAPSAS